ncbi:hypothetical protein IGB42_00816 [Andreprevotia sp. IGB-42]|uniref:DUF2298 domain-containing protein n=1 Tax=Andreprevotia sp. IGB-42 TaxID=2497473 RepID=UPI001357A08D|nr:DUF2298 domain-containing protein [Andreprevotia sp. IGB-42]KAF0814761.1 hypothetical protein IGB42_00816 [Andreprevotia sp. IGB-42]
MSAIYYFFTLALILLHFAAVSALLSRWVQSFHVARAGGILAFTLACFFIEHFQGLGKLGWLWPISTAGSLAVLWWNRDRLKADRFIRAELVFWVFVAYGLVWKWIFPSIYPTSERITDLFFITNYLPGATLPPPDHWFPQRVFDYYYAFQHYGAALMGRIFNLSPGLSYNFAMPLLMGMTVALTWDFGGRFIRHTGWKVLLVATLIIGGTGATPFVHLVRSADAGAWGESNNRMWGSARFIGLYDHDQTNTEIGRKLFLSQPISPGFERRELPMEGFGYQYFLGDYHPPLGGFFLLALALALIGMLEKGVGNRRANTALLAFSVPVTIATNTWIFPLQALLVAGWAIWRTRDKKRTEPSVTDTDWPALIAGGLVSFILLYPFLAGFAAKSLATPFKIVPWDDHTPWRQFLAQHWPMLLMIGIGMVRSETRRLATYFALAFGAMLFVSEFIFVDDPSGGKYERTNTTMKWWGWIWTGALISLGGILLGSPSRAIRWVVGISLAITCYYIVDVGNYIYYSAFQGEGSRDKGKLYAHATYTNDDTARDMFRYLNTAPDGVVMENLYTDAFNDGTVYAIFAVKPSLLGWPSHLMTWHGNVPEAWIVRDGIRSFYAGTLPDARTWLLAHDVRYIVWNAKDTANTAAWSKWQQEIGSSYAWLNFSQAGQPPVGFWVRRR